MASVEFIARGLSSGGWVHRGNAMYRLVSLHYELIPAAASGAGPRESVALHGRDHLRAGHPCTLPATDGQSVSHATGLGRVFGVRGPWPVSPVVRHLRFLIYQQASVPL